MIETILFGVAGFTIVILALVLILMVARAQLVQTGEVEILINGDPEKAIKTSAGSNLLNTLADNQIFIPSACGGQGTCGVCRVTVLEGTVDLDTVRAEAPDGIFVSNGPGDPAAVESALDAIRVLAAEGVPIFGICLGHQLIARAFGAETYKLPFGHHGGNHPVRNLDTDTVEITSQNHGFAVRAGEDGTIPGAPDLRLTHVNLYDGTVEGVAHRALPVFSVQYHPEAAPGPHDSRYLFDRFIGLMESRAAE